MQMGVLTQVFSFMKDFKKQGISSFLKRNLTFKRGMIIGLVTSGIGLSIDSYILVIWLKDILSHQGNFFVFNMVTPAIYSIFLIISGLQIVYFTLIFTLFRRPLDE